MGRSNSEDPKLTEVKAILADLQRMSPEPDPDEMYEPSTFPTLPAAIRLMNEPQPGTHTEVPEIQVLTATVIAPQTPAPKDNLTNARVAAALLASVATIATALIATGVFQPRLLPVGVAETATPARPELRPTAALRPPTAGTDVTMPVTASLGPAAPVSTPDALSGSATPRTPQTPADRSTIVSGELLTTPADAVISKSADERAILKLAERLVDEGKVIAGRAELMRLVAADSPDVALNLARSFDPNFLSRIKDPDASADIEEAAKWYRRWHALAVQQGTVADSVSIDRIIRSMRQ